MIDFTSANARSNRGSSPEITSRTACSRIIGTFCGERLTCPSAAETATVGLLRAVELRGGRRNKPRRRSGRRCSGSRYGKLGCPVKVAVDGGSPELLAELELPAVVVELDPRDALQVRWKFDSVLVQHGDSVSSEFPNEEAQFEHDVLTRPR